MTAIQIQATDRGNRGYEFLCCTRGNRYALWLDRSVSSVTNPEECISEGLRLVTSTRFVNMFPEAGLRRQKKDYKNYKDY
jgi:hypothetical protein